MGEIYSLATQLNSKLIEGFKHLYLIQFLTDLGQILNSKSYDQA